MGCFSGDFRLFYKNRRCSLLVTLVIVIYIQTTVVQAQRFRNQQFGYQPPFNVQRAGNQRQSVGHNTFRDNQRSNIRTQQSGQRRNDQISQRRGGNFVQQRNRGFVPTRGNTRNNNFGNNNNARVATNFNRNQFQDRTRTMNRVNSGVNRNTSDRRNGFTRDNQVSRNIGLTRGRSLPRDTGFRQNNVRVSGRNNFQNPRLSHNQHQRTNERTNNVRSEFNSGNNVLRSDNNVLRPGNRMFRNSSPRRGHTQQTVPTRTSISVNNIPVRPTHIARSPTLSVGLPSNSGGSQASRARVSVASSPRVSVTNSAMPLVRPRQSVAGPSMHRSNPIVSVNSAGTRHSLPVPVVSTRPPQIHTHNQPSIVNNQPSVAPQATNPSPTSVTGSRRRIILIKGTDGQYRIFKGPEKQQSPGRFVLRKPIPHVDTAVPTTQQIVQNGPSRHVLAPVPSAEVLPDKLTVANSTTHVAYVDTNAPVGVPATPTQAIHSLIQPAAAASIAVTAARHPIPVAPLMSPISPLAGSVYNPFALAGGLGGHGQMNPMLMAAFQGQMSPFQSMHMNPMLQELLYGDTTDPPDPTDPTERPTTPGPENNSEQQKGTKKRKPRKKGKNGNKRPKSTTTAPLAVTTTSLPPTTTSPNLVQSLAEKLIAYFKGNNSNSFLSFGSLTETTTKPVASASVAPVSHVDETRKQKVKVAPPDPLPVIPEPYIPAPVLVQHEVPGKRMPIQPVEPAKLFNPQKVQDVVRAETPIALVPQMTPDVAPTAAPKFINHEQPILPPQPHIIEEPRKPIMVVAPNARQQGAVTPHVHHQSPDLRHPVPHVNHQLIPQIHQVSSETVHHAHGTHFSGPGANSRPVKEPVPILTKQSSAPVFIPRPIPLIPRPPAGITIRRPPPPPRPPPVPGHGQHGQRVLEHGSPSVQRIEPVINHVHVVNQQVKPVRIDTPIPPHVTVGLPVLIPQETVQKQHVLTVGPAQHIPVNVQQQVNGHSHVNTGSDVTPVKASYPVDKKIVNVLPAASVLQISPSELTKTLTPPAKEGPGVIVPSNTQQGVGVAPIVQKITGLASLPELPIDPPQLSADVLNIAPFLTSNDLGGISIQKIEPSPKKNVPGSAGTVTDLLAGLRELLASKSPSSPPPATNPSTTSSTPAPTTVLSTPVPTSGNTCTPRSPDFKCRGRDMFSNMDSMGAWCLGMCLEKGCVDSVCVCDCAPTPPTPSKPTSMVTKPPPPSPRRAGHRRRGPGNRGIQGKPGRNPRRRGPHRWRNRPRTTTPTPTTTVTTAEPPEEEENEWEAEDGTSTTEVPSTTYYDYSWDYGLVEQTTTVPLPQGDFKLTPLDHHSSQVRKIGHTDQMKNVAWGSKSSRLTHLAEASVHNTSFAGWGGPNDQHTTQPPLVLTTTSGHRRPNWSGTQWELPPQPSTKPPMPQNEQPPFGRTWGRRPLRAKWSRGERFGNGGGNHWGQSNNNWGNNGGMDRRLSRLRFRWSNSGSSGGEEEAADK